MVLSRGLFLAGRYDDVRREIRETRAACAAASKSIGRDPVHLKIILETGELGTLDSIRFASDLAIDAATSVSGLPDLTDGEVFIKTSTGKIQPAATMPVTLIMLEAIRDHFLATGLRIGMKPAGGDSHRQERLTRALNRGPSAYSKLTHTQRSGRSSA